MDYVIEFSPEKNEILKSTRNIGFEEGLECIQNGGLLDNKIHHNKPNQRIYIVTINSYAYIIPYVIDEKTKKSISQGQKINEILKQDDQAPVPVEKQVCIFYGVLNGYFENVAVEDIKKTENELSEYIGRLHEDDILKPIRETGELPEVDENKLKEAITRFLESRS